VYPDRLGDPMPGPASRGQVEHEPLNVLARLVWG
jgi:hypothetical protein